MDTMKSLLLPLLAAVVLTTGQAPAQTAAPAAPAIAAAPGPSSAPAPTATVVRNVGPDEFDTLRGATNAVVLDVRSSAEYEDGHLPGAKLVDFRSPEFAQQVAKLDKSRTYLVHCAGGVRSAKACVKMVNLGFTNVVNLEGGLSAWEKAGKAVEK